MASLLHVDTNATFLTDEVASICPLLTPSPPTNALVNPLPESQEPNFMSPQELVTKLHQVEDDNTEGGDSASSNSSTLAEPACTQLLTGHKPYLHMNKNEETAAEETGGKTQSLQMTFRNPPENYFFMKWNWPIIRKISAGLFLTGIIAMVAVVIAMVWKLPKTCNPPTEWYQGKLMYEIFPASFSDSNDDGIGDLKGIASRVDYLTELGVQSVRLTSIFASLQYPENYNNVTSLTKIAPQLGNMTDFNLLVNALHVENIFLVLDIPIYPFIKNLNTIAEENGTETGDPIEDVLMYWSKHGVDGFYLKGLEFFVDDPKFSTSLRRWKKQLYYSKILIADYALIEATPSHIMNTVLNHMDLFDIRLDMSGGVEKISEQIEAVFNSTLFARPANPWVLWTLSNENTMRLANRLPYTNATVGASLIQMMLPGTPCLFYGDEIGLQQVLDPHEDRKGVEHLHQLAAMAWEPPNRPFTRKGIFPWMHSQPTTVNFAQFNVVAKMAALRITSPSIYINLINKDGVTKANAEIKYKENDLLVIQRWYPRRKSYVVVSNVGYEFISADLSTLLYSGQVVVGPTTTSKPESLSFKRISLWPGESVIIHLD